MKNSIENGDSMRGNTSDAEADFITPVVKPKLETVVDAAITADKNPAAVEIGGTDGPEPTRYGDWEHKGRCYDF